MKHKHTSCQRGRGLIPLSSVWRLSLDRPWLPKCFAFRTSLRPSQALHLRLKRLLLFNSHKKNPKKTNISQKIKSRRSETDTGGLNPPGPVLMDVPCRSIHPVGGPACLPPPPAFPFICNKSRTRVWGGGGGGEGASLTASFGPELQRRRDETLASGLKDV